MGAESILKMNVRCKCLFGLMERELETKEEILKIELIASVDRYLICDGCVRLCIAKGFAKKMALIVKFRFKMA